MNVAGAFGGTRLLPVSAVAWSVLVLPAAAYAQERAAASAGGAADEHLQEVVITGSRIARPET
jgi:hypothetical protein